METVSFSWLVILPFVLMLSIIAIFPLWEKTAHRWEKNSFKLLLALLLGIPVAVWMLIIGQTESVIHALVEYGQFIILLTTLFVISGNVFLQGDIEATPITNVKFLAVGGILASFVGTTGAAMILIRPLLNTNKERKYVVHTVIFFIFIVANCGGLLTPLGDPPLFLGMLRGVPFSWTFSLWSEWLFAVGVLLLLYFLMDNYYHSLEPTSNIVKDKIQILPIKLVGKRNLILLLGVVLSVAFLPSIDLTAYHHSHNLSALLPVREIIMGILIFLSLRGPQVARQQNEFNYHAIQEVAALFIGIFLTMIPALMYLRQVAPTLPLNEVTFFIFTGGLSSVLDNAPTYLTFFEMAQAMGGTPSVAGVYEPYLISISLGAVFCGAMTYIGNGPNFMVKAIAEERKIAMPSFIGYLKWSVTILIPLFSALVMIFIVGGWWTVVGSSILALYVLFFLYLNYFKKTALV